MNGIVGRWVKIDRYKDTKHQVMAVSYPRLAGAGAVGHPDVLERSHAAAAGARELVVETFEHANAEIVIRAEVVGHFLSDTPDSVTRAIRMRYLEFVDACTTIDPATLLIH